MSKFIVTKEKHHSTGKIKTTQTDVAHDEKIVFKLLIQIKILKTGSMISDGNYT